MATFKLVLVNCWLEQGPDGRPVQKFRDVEQIREVVANDLDGVSRVIRKKLRSEGKAVRSIAFATDGSIRAVIWRDGKPQVKPDKHMVWKRPPSSAGPKL